MRLDGMVSTSYALVLVAAHTASVGRLMGEFELADTVQAKCISSIIAGDEITYLVGLPGTAKVGTMAPAHVTSRS